MPRRTPAAELNEKLVVHLDAASLPFGLGIGQLTPNVARNIISRADTDGDVGPLYDIYERMETTDTMFGGLTDQLKAAVAGFRRKVVPAKTTNEKDRKLAEDYAETAREMMRGLNEHEVTRGFCAPHFTGAKAYLLSWEMKDYAYGRKLWMPKEVRPVRGRYLAVDKNSKSKSYGELMVREVGFGKSRALSSLPPESYILLQTDDSRDRYAVTGASRKCVSWFLGIQYVVAWWISFIEGYASPQRLAKYPRGTGADAKAELERFLRTLGTNGYGLFPNDVELIIQQANTAGVVRTYEDFVSMGHSQYAISLLGQADTVGGQSEGGYAKSVVSNSIRYEVLVEVASYVERGWTDLAAHTIRANYGEDADEALFPTIKPVVITQQEIATKTTTFVSLQAAGVSLPEDYPYEQILGIEPPREGEWCFLFGKRFRFGIDPLPEAPKGAEPVKAPSTRKNRDGDAPEGSRSVANDPNERED